MLNAHFRLIYAFFSGATHGHNEFSTKCLRQLHRAFTLGKHSKPVQDTQSLQTSAETSAVCNLWNNLVSLKHWEMWVVSCNRECTSLSFSFWEKDTLSLSAFYIYITQFVFLWFRWSEDIIWWTSGARWSPPVPAPGEAALAPGPASGKAKHVPNSIHKLLTELTTQTCKE